MTAKTTPSQTLLRQDVLGSRRLSNYLIASIVTLGAIGFLLAGISSYLQVNLLPFSDATELIFLPQGAAMTFYGVAGTLLSLYLWGTIALDVGGGYNEFDRATGDVTIFRWGFPGKNRQLALKFKTDAVQAVRVALKEGLNPQRALYLRVKDMRDIPLTRVGQPIALSELENQGAELARFLSVPLEGL